MIITMSSTAVVIGDLRVNTTDQKINLELPLRKHAYSFTSKNEKFQIKKNSFIFHISAQNIDVGTR